MEITVPRYCVDSDDDSSSGTPSPVLSLSSSASASSFPGARLSPSDALPEWQCKYTGKICPHPRARKTNGKLHRLCEEHRVRANVNQRRLQDKRRRARAEIASPYLLSPARTVEPLHQDWEDLVVEILKDDHAIDQEPLAAAAIASMAAEPLMEPCALTDEDVEALTLLFTSSISSDSTENEIYDVMCDAIHPKTS